MAGGNFLACGRIIHILDTVLAQHQAPVGLCLLGKVGYDCFIDTRGLIKLAGSTEPVCPGKQRQLFLIVGTGHRLPAAAVFTFRNGAARFNHQVTAAHFTLDNCHNILFSWMYSKASQDNLRGGGNCCLKVRVTNCLSLQTTAPADASRAQPPKAALGASECVHWLAMTACICQTTGQL